jgi:hypothetical protein
VAELQNRPGDTTAPDETTPQRPPLDPSASFFDSSHHRSTTASISGPPAMGVGLYDPQVMTFVVLCCVVLCCVVLYCGALCRVALHWLLGCDVM